VNIPTNHDGGSEKPAWGLEKWLETPRNERIITGKTGIAQFES